jgi:SnoaL-like domain
MSEKENVAAVERLFDGLNAKNVGVMNELFTDDSEICYPQSGECIRGRGNRQAVYEASPGLPTIAAYRTAASGDIVVSEAKLSYGEDEYQTVFVFEFRSGLIRRETVYWSKPFPAAAWRARWVEVGATAD